MKFQNFLYKKGNTQIKIEISDENSNLKFELQNKRNIDRKTLNMLRNKEIFAKIS